MSVLVHRQPMDAEPLVAQAMAERVPLVTTDRRIQQYDVETIW